MGKFNNCVVFSILIALSTSYPTQMPDLEIVDNCLEQNDISIEEIKDFENLEDNQNITDSDLSKYKCFTYCLFKDSQILDSHDKLDLQALMEQDPISEEESLIVLECKMQYDTEDDPCEYSFKMTLCIVTKIISKEEMTTYV